MGSQICNVTLTERYLFEDNTVRLTLTDKNVTHWSRGGLMAVRDASLLILEFVVYKEQKTISERLQELQAAIDKNNETEDVVIRMIYIEGREGVAICATRKNQDVTFDHRGQTRYELLFDSLGKVAPAEWGRVLPDVLLDAHALRDAELVVLMRGMIDTALNNMDHKQSPKPLCLQG